MITENHLLEEAAQKPISTKGQPMPIRRAVVIHFTAGATGQSSIDFWKEPKQKANDIGAHIVIERTGEIYQCRSFNKTISHAGTSRWEDPKTGKKYRSCNGFTIGIELANAGRDPRVIAIARRLPGFAGTMKARHRNGGPMVEWEQYPDAQFTSCLNVVKQLVERYNLDDITGHDCIAPNRKDDPGPAFPMERLRSACGFSGLPAVHQP
jgi:N-acetylmuramoyl-L-alanine amidase